MALGVVVGGFVAKLQVYLGLKFMVVVIDDVLGLVSTVKWNGEFGV